MKSLRKLSRRNDSEKKFIPRIDPVKNTAARPKPRKGEPLTIFLIALGINLAIVYLLNFIWVIGEVDALTTTANGLLTLYSANSGILPITLVEPPLTGLLQLIFIPILKEFHLTFLAGPILSAIAGALSLIFLNLVLLQMNVKPAFRWSLLALVQVSPSFLYLAATGTPDALFLFIIIFVIWGALQIAYNNTSFLICGFGLAIGFFVKYDSLAIAIGLVLALIVYKWKASMDWKVEIEGQLIAFITPIIYVLILWFAFNGSIMKDAFFFIKHLTSLEYAPDSVHNVGITHPFYLGWDNIFEAVNIGVGRVLRNSLVLTVTTIFAFIIALFNRKKYYFSILMIVLTMPVFNIIQIFLGTKPPGLYQWAYAVPFGMVLIGLLSQRIIPEKRYLFLILTVVLTGASILLTFESLSGDDVSLSEQRLAAILTGNEHYEAALRDSDPYWIFRHDGPMIAAEIDALPENELILINSADSAPIALFTQKPDHVVVVTGIDYETFFSYPGNQADKVLLLQEVEPINTAYAVQQYLVFSEASTTFLSRGWESDETILKWQIFRIAEN